MIFLPTLALALTLTLARKRALTLAFALTRKRKQKQALPLIQKRALSLALTLTLNSPPGYFKLIPKVEDRDLIKELADKTVDAEEGTCRAASARLQHILSTPHFRLLPSSTSRTSPSATPMDTSTECSEQPKLDRESLADYKQAHGLLFTEEFGIGISLFMK